MTQINLFRKQKQTPSHFQIFITSKNQLCTDQDTTTMDTAVEQGGIFTQGLLFEAVY